MRKIAIKIPVCLIGPFLVLLASGIAQETPIKLRVVTEQANIRLKPSIGSIIIHQVLKGTSLESSRKEGEWYQVKIKTDEGETVSGYVHESLVIETEGPAFEKEEKEKPLPTTPAPSKPPSARVSLCLAGGGNYSNGGDLNEGAKGLADYYSDSLGIQGDGEVKPVQLSYIFGGELHFPLSSRLFFGVGADYFAGKKESTVIFQSGASSETYTTRPEIQAIPVRAFFSLYPAPFLYIKTGAEYYFARCTYFYRFEKEESWQEWQGEAKAQDFGFFVGLGLVKNLSSHLGFFLEATSRYAKIIGFKGTDNYKKSPDFSSSETGTLYSYLGQTSGQTSYPLLFIREKKPSEAGVVDPKEATIDFSGISLKAGIKIRF